MSDYRSLIRKAMQTDEDKFYKDPRKVEVQEFAKSNAVSNDPTTFKNTLKEDRGHDTPVRIEKQEFNASPETPEEIKELPGGDDISTLNRFVVKSEEPDLQGAVQMNKERQAVKKVMANRKGYNGYGYPVYSRREYIPTTALRNAIMGSKGSIGEWAKDKSSFQYLLSGDYSFMALRNASSENDKYVDPYTMYIVHNENTMVVLRIGTHSSARGVEAFLKARLNDGKYVGNYMKKLSSQHKQALMEKEVIEGYILGLLGFDTMFVEELQYEVQASFKISIREINKILDDMVGDGLIDTDSSGYYYITD